MNGQSPEEPLYDLTYSDLNLNRAPNGKDAVEAFIDCLRATPFIEREAMMMHLRDRVCILCGAIDPNCPCWESEEAIPS